MCAHSLNATDIHTTGVETRAVLGRGEGHVQAALEEIRQVLPFRLRGIDSDNGSEFINDHLYRYGQGQEIQFTRGRPYKRDDNAHIEQKNWTHVRKLVGYWRYDTPAAVAALNARYQHVLRLFHNLFLPSVKLVAKERRRAPAPPLRCASHATTQDPSPQDDVLVGLGELMPSLAEWNISGRRRLASGQIPVGHGIVDCHRHDEQRADELGWARYGDVEPAAARVEHEAENSGRSRSCSWLLIPPQVHPAVFITLVPAQTWGEGVE